jgi:ABC-type oligopeptide transport system substrate-binding subunit
MILFAWEDAYGHGSYIADSAFTSGAIDAGCCNYPKYSSPKIDALTKQGHSPDQATSDEAYKELARVIVRDEVLWVPLLYPRRADLVNDKLQGFKVVVFPTGQSKPFRYYSLA